MLGYETLFCEDDAEFFDLECRYNLEFCGMSGLYVGWYWYCDDIAEVNVYTR